jgi:hypothetical protein
MPRAEGDAPGVLRETTARRRRVGPLYESAGEDFISG